MKKPKTINLPRGYLSYSQMILWENNPNEYMRVYFHGGKSYTSKYMEFGSEVSEDAEHATSKRETIKALNILLPTYSSVEYKIDAQIKTRAGILKLHGRLDTFNADPLRFRERKTGTVAWSQSKADKHAQIDFYYMLIFLSTNKMPIDAYLDWAETRVNKKGDIELTGEHKSYLTNRTLADVFKMISRATKVATEIAECYEKILTLKV